MQIRIAGRDYPPVLSIPQAAKILGQHRSTVHADIAAGRFVSPNAILRPGGNRCRRRSRCPRSSCTCTTDTFERGDCDDHGDDCDDDHHRDDE